MPAVSEQGQELDEVYVEANADDEIDLIQRWTGDDLVVEVDVEQTPQGRRYRCRSASVGIATILGRPTAQLVGHRIEEILPAPVALRTSQRLDGVIEYGSSCRVLHDADVADRLVSIETTTTPIRREDGSLSVLTVIRDATASGHAVRSAERARGMLQRVFESSPDMIALVGADGKIQYANAAFARVLGFDPVTLVGTPLTALLDGPSGVALNDLAGKDSSEPVVARIRTSDGGWRDVDVTVNLSSYVADSSAEPAAAVLVIRDVTVARHNDRVLTRRRHQMAAMADLGQLALAEHNLDTVLAAAVRSLTDGLEVPFAEVARYDEHRQVMLLASIGMDATRTPAPAWGADDEPEGVDSSTWLMTAPDPLVVNDWRDETRCRQDITLQVLGSRSCVSVAIHTRMGVWGLLTGSDHQTRQFTVHDANFARGISHLIAAAVERHDVEEQLRRQAVHDPLTGLANRSLLLERIMDAFERRDLHPVMLGFVDLDDFSAINNRSGHTAGDHVLAEIARRLAGQVRHGDTVARIGGDEFIVMLEGLDDAEALAIAHRILAALRHPIHLPGQRHSITVTASIGLASLHDTHQTPEHLIDAADEAMYAAKTRGGDAVVKL